MARGGDGGGTTPLFNIADLPPQMADLAQLLNRPPPAAPDEETLMRQRVAAMMVAALQDAEAARATAQPPSQASLARQAYDKLQFDFPVVDTAELRALEAEYTAAVAHGGFPAAMPVTAALLANVTDGANPSPVCSSRLGVEAAPEAESASVAMLPKQVAYHRLCAVLCIKAARSMLAAPVAAASETLAALHPPEPPADPNRAITGSGGTGTSEAAVTAAMDSLTLNAAAAATDGAAAAAAAAAAEVLAEVMDSDTDDEWEPLEDTAGASHAPPRLPDVAAERAAAAAAAADAAATPEQRAVRKLVTLCGGVSYDLVCAAGVWEELSLSDDVVDILGLLQAHPVPALRGLVPIYAALLCDRWGAAPSGPGGMEQMLAKALGKLGVDMGAAVSSADAAGLHAGLYDEQQRTCTVLALSLLASLAGRLGCGGDPMASRGPTGAVAARTLWTQLHALLPALARHLAVLATEAKDRVSQHAWAMETEMVATLTEVYVCEASASVDPGRALLQAGLFRDLVHIVSAYGALTSLAATRRTFLTCLSAAAPLRKWAAAVPALTSRLLTPPFASGGPLEAHGALWPLLMGDGGAEDAAAARMVALLDELAAAAADASTVARIVRCLEPLQRAAAVRRSGLVVHLRDGTNFKAALVALQMALRRSAHPMPIVETSAVAAPTDVRTEAEAQAQADGEEEGEATEHLATPGVSAVAAVAAESRGEAQGALDEKARQIAGQALRILKDVLAAGQETSRKAD